MKSASDSSPGFFFSGLISGMKSTSSSRDFFSLLASYHLYFYPVPFQYREYSLNRFIFLPQVFLLSVQLPFFNQHQNPSIKGASSRQLLDRFEGGRSQFGFFMLHFSETIFFNEEQSLA